MPVQRQTRRLLYGAGARHVAVWPDEARVSVWDMPTPDLAVLLYQMIETDTGNAPTTPTSCTPSPSWP
jgi:hypothetical protein